MFEIQGNDGVVVGRAVVVADEGSRLAVELPPGIVTARAYNPAADFRTHPIAASVTFPTALTLRVQVPVLHRRGRCYLDLMPPTPLKNYLIVWRDTGDNRLWQGTRADGNADYALWEEQARAYTLYALSEVSKTWLVLKRIVTNPDGSRDLYFALWSWPNHPFFRRDNPLGGLPDVASRDI